MSIINAIMQVGGNLISALSGTASPGGDQLQKTINTLKKLMLPELDEELEKRVEEVKSIMVSEEQKGPFKVRPLDYDKGIKNRIRIRRKTNA